LSVCFLLARNQKVEATTEIFATTTNFSTTIPTTTAGLYCIVVVVLLDDVVVVDISTVIAKVISIARQILPLADLGFFRRVTLGTRASQASEH